MEMHNSPGTFFHEGTNNSMAYASILPGFTDDYQQRALQPGFQPDSHGSTVSLHTFHPSRDPSTGWRCHSTDAGGAVQY